MNQFENLICADCGSDNIQSNGDNDCCCDCGSHDYTDISEETDTDPIKPLVNLFDAWAGIHGGKQ